MSILEQHDIILNEYNTKKQQQKEYEEKGQLECARAVAFYADGISYVYSQIFQLSIENAKTIGYYEKTKLNQSGIWKQI